MKSLWKAVQYLLHGQFGPLLAGLQRRLPPFLFRYSRGDLFELHCPSTLQPPQNAACFPADYDLSEFYSEHIEICAALSGLPSHELRRRFENGDRCIGVVQSDQPVNVNWLHYGSCYVRGLGLRIDLGTNDCYLYGVVTATEHRGKGLYRQSQLKLIQLLQSGGLNRIVQLVEKGNEVPLKTLPKLGYQLLWSIRHLTIMGVQRTIILDTQGRVISRQYHLRQPADVVCI